MAAKGRSAEWLTEDGLLRVQGWARDGCKDKEICKRMRITTTTFYEWKNKFPAFAEAIKKGRAPFDEEVESAAYKAAVGYFVEEVDTIETTENGVVKKQITTKKRWIKPEPALICYILNNRKKGKWSNQPKSGGKETEDRPMIICDIPRGNPDGKND